MSDAALEFRLHSDSNFHYEILRSLGATPYFGGDIQEHLALMPRIKPGDFDGWYKEWSDLAKRVLKSVDLERLEDYSPVTIRNVFLRASHYHFNSDFFLHGNWNDPRSSDAFEKWTKYYDIANAHLHIPGQKCSVPTTFGDVPMYIYRTADASTSQRKPLIIIGGGFDSNMPESMHTLGFDALERGYNVLIFEGPGQPSFLHRQQPVGFVYDWEKVITPIVDHILARSEQDLSFVDTGKIALAGLSFGGELAARAAAFEPRLAALICIDGVYSFFECCHAAMSRDLQDAWAAKDKARFDALFHELGQPTSSTNQRWFHDHGLFSFQETSGFEWFRRLEKFALDREMLSRVKMPAFIGDAEKDLFFLGQPPKVADAIGDNATLFRFTDEQGAGAHCASGALVYQNQQVWEWFERTVVREG